MFRPMIQFQLIFVYGLRCRLSFFLNSSLSPLFLPLPLSLSLLSFLLFSRWTSGSVVQHHFLNILSFLYWISFVPLLKIYWQYMWVHFWTVFSYVKMSVLLPTICVLHSVAFIIDIFHYILCLFSTLQFFFLSFQYPSDIRFLLLVS